MKNYCINEFTKRVGRSVQTIRRREREGKLTAKRLPYLLTIGLKKSAEE